MRCTLRLASLMVVVSVLWAAPAWAQIRLLVLDPQSPFLSADQLSALGQTLSKQAADYEHLQLLEASDLKTLQKKAACKNTSNQCLRSIGRTNGAQRVLFTQVQKLPGRHLLLMRLLDVRSGKLLKQSRQRTRTGSDAMNKALIKGWISLFGRLVECSLEIKSNVADAEIRLDGRPIGQPPLLIKRKLVAGPHTLTGLHADYKPLERRITIMAKQPKMRINMNLKLKPPVDDIAPVALVSGIKPPGPKTPAPEDDGPTGIKLGGGDKDDDPADGEPGTGKLKGDKDDSSAQPIITKLDPKPVKLDPKPVKVDPKPDGPIAGPLLKNKLEKKPVLEKPFLPKEKNEPEPLPPASKPIYKKWWFWSAIGAAVVAGVVTGTVVGMSDSDGIPSGKGRVLIDF